MRIALLFIVSLTTACPGGPYDPCTAVDDCDPALVDACFKPSGAREGFCTLLCQTSEDCPEGPEGQRATCQGVPVPLTGSKVCALP